jgi:hypothetical protein
MRMRGYVVVWYFTIIDLCWGIIYKIVQTWQIYNDPGRLYNFMFEELYLKHELNINVLSADSSWNQKWIVTPARFHIPHLSLCSDMNSWIILKSLIMLNCLKSYYHLQVDNQYKLLLPLDKLYVSYSISFNHEI